MEPIKPSNMKPGLKVIFYDVALNKYYRDIVLSDSSNHPSNLLDLQAVNFKNHGLKLTHNICYPDDNKTLTWLLLQKIEIQK